MSNRPLLTGYYQTPRGILVPFVKLIIEKFGGCLGFESSHCRLRIKILEVKLDRTDFYTVPNFERDMGDRILRAVVNFEDHDRVEFSDIRRICRALEIRILLPAKAR